jgi:hypothetical protein
VRSGAQPASIIFAAVLFALVFEMVRRRRLGERYAILWLASAFVLLVLAVWTRLLASISKAVGISTPSNAFFVIAFTFLLLLLLHFSAVASRLADETRVLAQRVALLEQRLRAPRDEDDDFDLAPAGGGSDSRSGVGAGRDLD